MDPEEALYQCDQAISDLRLEDATASLAAYREWRKKGGFEPNCLRAAMMGDKFADQCEQRIVDATPISIKTTTRENVREIARQFVARAQTQGMKGVKRDVAALEFLVGAMCCANHTGQTALFNALGFDAAMVAMHGYYHVESMVAE
jgi:hypothetical protein